MLDWPQATFASKVEFSADKKEVTVTREVDGGLEVVAFALPGVITTDLRLNEPRYASLPGIMKARKKELKEIPLADSALDAAPQRQDHQPRSRRRPSAPRVCKVETVQELVNLLHTEAQADLTLVTSARKEHSGVSWVRFWSFIEHQGGHFPKSSLVAVHAGLEAAKKAGGDVRRGPRRGCRRAADEPANTASRKVIALDDHARGSCGRYVRQDFVRTREGRGADEPDRGRDRDGQGPDAAVAARLDAPMATDLIAINEDGTFTRPTYAGNVIARSNSTARSRS